MSHSRERNTVGFCYRVWCEFLLEYEGNIESQRCANDLHVVNCQIRVGLELYLGLISWD